MTDTKERVPAVRWAESTQAEGLCILKSEVEEKLRALKKITKIIPYFRALIWLAENYPRPYQRWTATKFDGKTGNPVSFGWKAARLHSDLFTAVYTHPGFSNLIPCSGAVKRELIRIVGSGKAYELNGYVIRRFLRDYNEGTAWAGVEIVPLHSLKELENK